MDLKALKCNNCGAGLRSKDISTHLGLVHCHHCEAVYSLNPGHPGAAPKGMAVSRGGGAAGPKPLVGRPEEITVSEGAGGVEITRKWYGHDVLFLLFFTFMWNGFMAVWHTTAFLSGAYEANLFGLLHPAVGLGLIYYVAARLLNRTYIRLERGQLSVRHAPVPWKGGKEVPATRLEQLYCKEQRRRTKNGERFTYSVEMLMQGHRRETLLEGLSDFEHALFIEQTLEKALGITDVPIPGEHRG